MELFTITKSSEPFFHGNTTVSALEIEDRPLWLTHNEANAKPKQPKALVYEQDIYDVGASVTGGVAVAEQKSKSKRIPLTVFGGGGSHQLQPGERKNDFGGTYFNLEAFCKETNISIDSLIKVNPQMANQRLKTI
jgi:hypothetical protein